MYIHIMSPKVSVLFWCKRTFMCLHVHMYLSEDVAENTPVFALLIPKDRKPQKDQQGSPLCESTRTVTSNFEFTTISPRSPRGANKCTRNGEPSRETFLYVFAGRREQRSCSSPLLRFRCFASCTVR